MTRYVYDFSDGDRDMADLLGGKGANLAEMTRIGLPVRPGFSITTEACRAYLAEEAQAWTTSRARHCGSLSRGSRPAVQPWRPPGLSIPKAAEQATPQPAVAGVGR